MEMAPRNRRSLSLEVAKWVLTIIVFGAGRGRREGEGMQTLRREEVASPERRDEPRL